MLNRVHLALIAMGGVTTSSCGIFDFEVGYLIPTQTVSGNAVAAAAGQLIPAGSFFPNPFSFTINLEQETSARDTGPASKVWLKSLSLSLDSASIEPNFDWLDELHVYVESTKAGTTLSKQEIALLAPVAKGLRTLQLTMRANVDLLPYINEGNKVTSQATARSPAQDVVFSGAAVFRVEVL